MESNGYRSANRSSLRFRRNATNNENAKQVTKRPKSSGEINTNFLEETGKRRSLPKFEQDDSYLSANHLSVYSKEDQQSKTNTIDGYYKKGLQMAEKITVGQPRGISDSPIGTTTKKSFFETVKSAIFGKPNSEKLKRIEEDYRRRLKEHEESIRNIKIKCEQREEAFMQRLKSNSGIPFNSAQSPEKEYCWVEEVD